MSEAAWAAIASVLTALCSLVGVYFANRKSQGLIAYRLEQLEKTVNKHNQVADRVTTLEGKVQMLLESIKELRTKV